MRVLTTVPMEVPRWKIDKWHTMWLNTEEHGYICLYYKYGCAVVVEMTPEEHEELENIPKFSSSLSYEDFMKRFTKALESHVTMVDAVKRTLPQNLSSSDKAEQYHQYELSQD